MDIKPQLPKTIYVYLDVEGYLFAGYTMANCADKDEARLVGVYTLTETKTVTLEVKENVIVS
jgi:hypothetical protein